MKILVTGSANGLGFAIQEALLVAGHEVIEFDNAHHWPNRVQAPPLWLRDIDRLDGLINCAGINSNEWFEHLSYDTFEWLMSVNAWGAVAMTQSVLEQLKASKGFVCNIVSNAAHIPMTSSLAYNASKAAALMITKQMAHELTPKHGITVFSVSPNKLRGTNMSREIEANVCHVRGWTKEYAAEYQKKALMHGLESEPSAVAEFITNLIVSGQYKFMSGCDIPFGK
jgi:NAD(P)-dependent dehydrogenase (short-subunit alcohol dehydrogenase family)